MAHRSITFRLCLMMFLEYAVRGMWYPYLANYLSAPRSVHGLGFTSGQTGWVLGFANALGAFTAPIIAGQVADRYLNAEKALATLHCIAAVLLFTNASSMSFTPFFCIMLCFSIAYVPTQSLTNSLALSHLTDREHTYPRVRMWGTIGWIVTSASFTFIVLRGGDRATNIARIPYAMRAAAILALCYAGYAMFVLPATPPRDSSRGPVLSKLALRMMREPSVLVLMLIALPIAAIHTAYYLNIGPFLSDVVGVPLKFVGPTLAISQLSEVIFLFTLGPLLRRFGYRAILTVGALAQAVRFTIFALNLPAPLVIVSLTLHGVAFACFFATAILYIEQTFPAEVRHSAQTVFGIVLFGLGPALAGPYSQVFDRFTVQTAAGVIPNFHAVWWTQAGIAALSAIALAILFRPRNTSTEQVVDAATIQETEM
ncbi:MAG TPA: MFS transporter [Tepidisphaeraceae bacterium]|jgi:nucleoside transporter